MARKNRFIPPGGALVEVTCRTLQSRFLLTPSQTLNDIIVGALARAQRRHEVKICGLVCLSTHMHLLLWVENAQQLTQFMHLACSKIAREAAQHTGWREKIWGRRYQAILVTSEDAAQIDRLVYILRNSVKEGLVASPRDWPGVHCASALIEGTSLQGHWFDRTKEGAARRRGETFTKHQYATPETLEFTPLPCWKHLSAERYRRRIADLVQAIEKEAEQRRLKGGREPLGAEAVMAESPRNAPAKQKRSPAPAFHAASRAARQELRDAYAEFMRKYREASARLRAGDRMAVFPEGSFPPALPFVQ